MVLYVEPNLYAELCLSIGYSEVNLYAEKCTPVSPSTSSWMKKVLGCTPAAPANVALQMEMVEGDRRAGGSVVIMHG